MSNRTWFLLGWTLGIWTTVVMMDCSLVQP